MKLKNIFLASTVALGITMMAGCSKSKFDINSNPDDVTDESVTPSVLLPGALQATSTNIASEWWFIGWWMGHGARSGSYQSFNEEETYKFTNDFHASVWNTLYGNANNYQIMINKSMESGAGAYEAIGRIMKSHNFQILVDIYGNIPYTDAFKGTAASTPKYDKAIDIYNAIFADLDRAIELLNDDAASDPAINPDIAVADFAYRGDRTQWRKVANTLRLRMLLHLHNGVDVTTVAPGVDVAAQMAKITSDGFLGAGESLQINPGFSGTKPQAYYRFFNTTETGTGSQRDWARASAYAIGYYKYNGDPRINRFYVSPNGTTAGQTGIPFGTPSGASAPIGSSLSSVRGPGLSPGGANSRAWILTSVESLFLQAEARQRGLLTSGPTAQQLLASAVTESFVWLGLTAADATTYMTNNATYPDVDITAPSIVTGEPGGGVFTILSQKWFALNSIAPYEVWSDFRRSGIKYGAAVDYDAGPTISVDPNAGTKIPVRLFYPQNEYNYNAANVAAEGTIDVLNTKIFWDLN